MNDLLDEDLIEKQVEYRFWKWPVIVWLIILAIGLVCRLQHWPGRGVLINVSSASLWAYSISEWKALKGKNTLNNVACVLGILWLVFMVIGELFNNGHPYNKEGIIAFLILFVAFFIGYELVKKRNRT